MGYYNPSRWININDQLLSNIERKLKMEKEARPSRGKHARSFLPPWCLELDIMIKYTNELLRLSEWIDREGKIYINLTDASDIYRKGHFKNLEWHTNPNSQKIQPPHHVHFPTVKYSNLNRPHTYAYPIRARHDYLGALVKFCRHNNIEIKGVSLPLLRR